MSLLINTGLLSEIKAKTDSLPATPASQMQRQRRQQVSRRRPTSWRVQLR